MNRELLSKAFGEIDEKYIAEAYRPVSGAASGSSERIVHMRKKRMITLALAAVLLLSVGAVTYALKPSIYGWGGNFEVRDTGEGIEAVLHTDSLTDPVTEEDGRLWFVVNDEHMDITDRISEAEPFLYDYTDEEGIVHYWIVGKNGPKLGNWGYAEYLHQAENDWTVGYSARTNLDPDSEGPLWLQAGKSQLNIHQ